MILHIEIEMKTSQEIKADPTPKNTKPTQNPRCNHSNYNTRYKRYKFNETNN